jgi:hypothetical protein
VLYARFIGDSVDYVLNQLIQATTLAKARDFIRMRPTDHQDEPATIQPVARFGPITWRRPGATREDDSPTPPGSCCTDY